MNVQVQPIYLMEHEQFNKYSMWKSDKINPETGSHLTADIQIHFIKRRYSGLCSALWGAMELLTLHLGRKTFSDKSDSLENPL